MRRFREMTTETAGFYNTVGFNDDTRAFMFDPRPPRRGPPGGLRFLATLVATGRLSRGRGIRGHSNDLAHRLATQAYRL
jgi:glucuronate isomerase